MDRFDFIVVGAGSSGTSIAFNLVSRRAGTALLVDRAGIAAGATGRSSAIIRQHYSHEALARMALFSLRVFQDFANAVGGTAEFRRTGYLALYGKEDVDALRANVAMQRLVGIDTTFVLPGHLGDIEPRLSTEGVAGAAWEPESGYADPASTTASYVSAGRAQGLEIRLGTTVERVAVEGGRVRGIHTADGVVESDCVFIAAGYRTPGLLDGAASIPLTPVRHAIAVIERTPGFGDPHPVIADRVQGVYFRSEGHGLSLAGMSGGFDGVVDTAVEQDRPPRDDDTTTLAQKFALRFPSEQGLRLRPGYTGVYDCSPDLHPVLGAVTGAEGLYVACGLSGHGFKLAPAIGAFLVDIALNGRSALAGSDAFEVARFAQNRSITSARPYIAKSIP